MGPTLGFYTNQRNSFFDQIWCFLQLKQDSDNIIQLIMRKSHFNDEFLVLLGSIISSVFPCSNEEKLAMGAGSSPIYGIEVSYIDRRTRAYFIAM